MSSPIWMKNLEEAFPEYQVEDYAGNSFAIVKNFKNKQNEEVAVLIHEIVVFTYKDPKQGNKLVTLDSYNELSEEDYGKYFIDMEAEFVPLIELFDEVYHVDNIKDEQNILKEAYEIFDNETVEFLKELHKTFIKEYWKAGGYE